MAAAVDFLCNPITHTVVDDAWARAAQADGITRVRAAITADASGHVPGALVAEGASAWQRAGIAVDAVLAYEYLPPFTVGGVLHCPNEAVGTGTHRLTTPYIERFRLQLEAWAPTLMRAGIQGFYAWNEPAVGLVKVGEQCPPDGRVNRSCLDSTAYASLIWQTCHSLQHVGCTRRIAGAYNIRTSTGLDTKNPYLLGHLGGVYAHLKACGVAPNWTHLGLTIYGYWDLARTQHLHDTITAFMVAHGDHSALVCAEYGVENKGADVVRLRTTRDALTTVFGDPAGFMRPGRDPYLGPVEEYPGYGWYQWREAERRFVLGAKYPIGHALLDTP